MVLLFYSIYLAVRNKIYQMRYRKMQVSPVQSSQVMQILAPIVLNALGNQSQQSAGGINVGSITSILSNFGKSSTAGSLSIKISSPQLIDRNGDGNVADDVVGLLKVF